MIRKRYIKRTLSLMLAFSMLFSMFVTNAYATDTQNSDSDGILLTKDGAAQAGIVVPADASDMEKYAAEELQYHAAKVSGATLPISTEIGGFTASFLTDSITAESSGYYPVELTLQNPTDETYEVTIRQESEANGMPALVIRGTDEIGGTVSVAPKTEVLVSGVVYVEDIFTFNEYSLSVKFLAGENELATDTLNIINGVAAANLVTNGGFETVKPENGAYAFSPWWLPEDCFEIETEDVHSGSTAVKLKGITNIYGYDTYVLTKPNKVYTVSFWAKGAGASFSVIRNEHISSEVWGGKVAKTFQLTDNWAKYQFTFSTYADEAPEYRGIWMNLGVEGGTVLLDDFVFMEAPAGTEPDEPEQEEPSEPSEEPEIVNLVSNGDFETVNPDGAEYTFGPWWLPTDCFEIESTDVHGGNYAVKLKGATEIYGYDSWVKTKPGTAYTVSFWAKGAGALFTVKTSGTDTGRATFRLTDNWTQYQVTLNTLPSEDPSTYNGIWMNLGVAGGVVLLDDFIFTEAPDQPETVNLVSNGNFETVNPDGAEYTFSPWWLPTDCFEVETADVHGGSYAVKLKGETEIYGYDSWVKTKPGTAYTVSFWAKGAGASFTVKTSSTDTDRATFQLTDGWTLYQFILTTLPSEDPAYNGIWMNLGVAGGTVLLDDFIFMETPAEIIFEPEQEEPSEPSEEPEIVNLVTNGDFETVNPDGAEYTFAPWWLPTDCFTVETEDVHGGSYAVKLTGATEIYGYDSWVKTKPDTSYTVSFWAKGAGASFTVKTSGTDTARATFQLTDDWAQYQFTLNTLPSEDPSTYNGIWMNLGVAGGVVLLDDFVFAETPEEAAPDTPELPEIAAPVVADFVLNATIMIATPNSYPQLNDLFADDIAWLEATGEPGDDERYGDDGFAIRQVGDIIYIFGVTERGVLNGVYDFIEENMGVLWTRADEELGLIYNEMPTVTANKVNYREKSPFAMRGWHLCGNGAKGEFHSDPATEIMMARNKLNAKLAEPGNSDRWDWQTGIGIAPFHLTHNVSSWILNSPSYDPNYLEYWNTDESGNHYVPGGEGWNPSAHQINFWDQGADAKTLQTMIDSVLKFLNDNPDAKYVGVGIEDTYNCTQIPEQSADFEYAPGQFVSPTDENYLSTVCFSFINKVAQAVAEQYPDVMVNAYAYFFAEIPPACDIEDNICVVFAPINEDVTDTIDTEADSPNKVYFEMLNKWAAKTSNVVTYNYYGCFRPSAYYERPIADKIQSDMQFYAANGFSGLMPEGVVDAGASADTWAMNALTFWLYSKLAWNPNEDLDALIQEFCDKAYGDASEYMQEYYGYVKQGWENGKEGVNIRWDSNLNAYLDAFVKDCGFIDEMQAALDNAWNAANDLEKERIRHIKLTFEENIQSLGAEEEAGSASYTNAGKDAVLATIDLDDPFADEIWADAQVLERFLYHATMKPVGGVDMKVRMLWDDEYLYVGYENFDSTIDDMPVADLAGAWWDGACTDVETFIAAELDGTLYDYFTNPRAAYFRYYRESGGNPTFDDVGADWDAAARIFDVEDVNQDRWIAIQAISFESIGITDPVTAATEVYATFFRDLGTGNSLGWNGASVWDFAYLDQITLEGGPQVSDISSVAVVVTAPVAGTEKQTAVEGGSGYSAAIEWNCDTEKFGFNTAYTATVTLTADENHKFANDLTASGWTVVVSADGKTATLTKTFDATRLEKLTEISAPENQVLSKYYTNVADAIQELPAEITYTTESGSVTAAIEWTCTDYDNAVSKTNEFAWTVKDGELAVYDVNGIATSGTITVTNASATAVGNSSANKSITYDGNTYDVAEMFTIDENAGEASYTIVGGTGAGTLNGSVLTITKAGTIEVQLSTAANGAYAADEVTAILTVNKGAGFGSVEINGWTYGEDAQSPVVNSSTNDTADVTYLYASIDGKGYHSTVAPQNAGNYKLTATFAETDLYEVCTDVVTFTVEKKTLTITAQDNAITYGELPAANGVTGSGFVNGEDMDDLTGELTYAFSYSQYDDIGVYKITPAGLTSSNYEIVFVDGNLTVNAKAITVTADDKSKVYGDVDPELTYIVDGLVNGDELSGVLARVTGENVGDYDITQGTLVASENYTVSYIGAKLTINAKAITAADVKLDGSLTYTGSEQTQQIIVTEGITYEVSGNKATDVGTYELTVRGTGNYTGEVKLSWSIMEAGAAAIATAPTANDLTYNGKDQPLVTAGTTADGKLVYSLSKDGDYSETIPTGKDADNYTVWYYVQGDANHADSEKASVEVIIRKAELTVAAKDQTITYGDTISGTEFTSIGLVDGHSLTVALSPSTANVTVNGTITASAAVITADGVDVTKNYEISYADGKLVIEPDTSKIEGLTTDNVTSANEADIKEVQTMMENAESIEEEWADIAQNCEALLEKIEAVGAENKRIAKAVSKFNLFTVKASDKAAITQLISDIDAQLATNNLTDEERAELECLKVTCEKLISKINSTNAVIKQINKLVKYWIQKISNLPKWPNWNSAHRR